MLIFRFFILSLIFARKTCFNVQKTHYYSHTVRFGSTSIHPVSDFSVPKFILLVMLFGFVLFVTCTFYHRYPPNINRV